MREGLLEAGGGGGGAGRLGRPGLAPAAARGVPGGSGGTAALAPSAGCEELLFALAAPLLGGAEGLGDAAPTPESCPGLPAGNQISHVCYTPGFALSLLRPNSAKGEFFIYPTPGDTRRETHQSWRTTHIQQVAHAVMGLRR